MEYVIKIGKNFIGMDSGGRYTEVTNLSQAIKGPVHKLNNVINNCVTPSKRTKCKIVAENTIVVKPVAKPTVKSINSDDSLFEEVITKLKAVNSANFDKAQNILCEQQKEIDQEISDIYHYIEFNALNAADGYKAYKMLHEKLQKRRVIKDDYSKFQILTNSKVSDIFDGTLDDKLNDFEKRTYTPRVLTELFEN